MFEVGNAIAYDGLVIHGNTREVGDGHELVRGSIWTHVPALPGKEKWNPEEGEMARRLLARISLRVQGQLR